VVNSQRICLEGGGEGAYFKKHARQIAERARCGYGIVYLLFPLLIDQKKNTTQLANSQTKNVEGPLSLAKSKQNNNQKENQTKTKT